MATKKKSAAGSGLAASSAERPGAVDKPKTIDDELNWYDDQVYEAERIPPAVAKMFTEIRKLEAQREDVERKISGLRDQVEPYLQVRRDVIKALKQAQEMMAAPAKKSSKKPAAKMPTKPAAAASKKPAAPKLTKKPAKKSVNSKAAKASTNGKHAANGHAKKGKGPKAEIVNRDSVKQQVDAMLDQAESDERPIGRMLILDSLPRTPAKLLEVLLDIYPNESSKWAVVAEAKCKGELGIEAAFERLVEDDYIEFDGDRVRAANRLFAALPETPAKAAPANRIAEHLNGVGSLSPAMRERPVPTAAEAQASIANLNRMERSLLRAALAEYPSAVAKGILGKKAGYQPGGKVSKAWRNLEEEGLIVQETTGAIRATGQYDVAPEKTAEKPKEVAAL